MRSISVKLDITQQFTGQCAVNFVDHVLQISNLVSKVQECEKYISEVRPQHNSSQVNVLLTLFIMSYRSLI